MGVGAHGGPRIERYQLPDLWCLHLCRYDATVRFEEQTFPIRRGYAGIIPANMPIEYHFGSRFPQIYTHFRIRGSDTGETAIPAMQDLGDAFRRIYEQLEQVTQSDARRVRTRLWDVLRQLAGKAIPEVVGVSAHPAVSHALKLIERRLGKSLRVAVLATDLGVSESYLRLLFQQGLGMTVIG